MDVSKRISDVPEWFKGARLNYAENLLKHADQDKVALYAASKYVIQIKSCDIKRSYNVYNDIIDIVLTLLSPMDLMVPCREPGVCMLTHKLFAKLEVFPDTCLLTP